MEPITIVFLILAALPYVLPNDPVCTIGESVVVEDVNGNPKDAELYTPSKCKNLKVLEYKK